ncbi:MAG: hypothetical protein ABIK15_06030 [Pseudomonadota bacterium]
MVQILIILVGLLIASNPTLAEINTTEIPQSNELPKSEEKVFDGTENFLYAEDIDLYIGQELYVKGNIYKWGYKGFFIDLDYFDLKYFDRINKRPNIYEPENGNSSNSGSQYDKLVGKYFTVVDVIRKETDDNELLLFLKLQAKDTKELLYFKYPPTGERFSLLKDLAMLNGYFPFLSVKYFETQKKREVGKKYIFRRSEYFEPPIDIETGEKVYTQLDSVWECVDLTLEKNNWVLSAILKSNTGRKLLYSLENLNLPINGLGAHNYASEVGLQYVFEKSIADKYRKKLGTNNWKLILSGSVIPGMTKEMCELALGVPYDMNRTETTNSIEEQWIYKNLGKYVYFKNNIVTSVQD